MRALRRHVRRASAAVLCIVGTVIAADAPSATSAPTTRPAAVRAKIGAFLEAVDRDPKIDKKAKRVIRDAWTRRQQESDPESFLEEALSVISPPYRAALDAIRDGKYAQAETTLRTLQDSDNPYIAVHAGVRLARVLLEQNKFDETQRVFDAWQGKYASIQQYSFQAPDFDFMQAYTLLANLQYEAATKALSRFLEDHPDAPERLRVTARQMLQELAQRKPNGIGDIADLMTYAGRQLAAGKSDAPVLDAQQHALALLEQLIEQTENQEQQSSADQSKQSQGQGKGQQAGTPAPSGPAQQSQLPEGAIPEGPKDRNPVVRPGEQWGQMPPRQRERILQSLRQNFPSRYRELVEQYYQQMGRSE